jgi:dUTP pyrophosphatase
MVAIANPGAEPVTIARGERIAQGIFVRYLATTDDTVGGARTGGFGSTGA